MVQRWETLLHLAHLSSHAKDIADFSLGEEMYKSVVQQIAHHVERQDISAQVHQADVKGRSGSIVKTARSTGHEPNLIQYESGTRLMSIADGDDEDLMGMDNSQLEQAPFSL